MVLVSLESIRKFLVDIPESQSEFIAKWTAKGYTIPNYLPLRSAGAVIKPTPVAVMDPNKMTDDSNGGENQ